jgi:hypothetical protein
MAWTFCPGASLSEARISLGMTTWNLGEIVTVSMGFLSIKPLYDDSYILARKFRR